MIKYIAILLLIPTLAIAGAKTYGTKKDYTRQQKIQRGDITKPKLTTCRLKKLIQSKSGDKACIYEGGNKTFELLFDNNCPKQFKCKYQPNGKEPNIDQVMDSLNQIGK
jgi:hypothetical protein